MTQAAAITIVIPSLARGGAELVASRLANWLSRGGMAVRLVTFQRGDDEWPVNAEVQRSFINDWKTPPRGDLELDPERTAVAALRSLLATQTTHSIISFLTRMNLRVLQAAPAGVRVVVCERSYPPARNFPPQLACQIADMYPAAHALVVQTERCARNWADTFMPFHRTHVLPNPFFPRDIPPDPIPVEGPYILAVGRFVPEKDISCLLHAFATVHPNLPDHSLVLVGDGPLRQALEDEAHDLGIAQAVHFNGFCANPAALYRQADCFALPSRYEGFPNALLEALWHGAPCVAADCTAGPAEMLGDGRRGLLFPPGDCYALARCLLHVCTNDGLRRTLAERGTAHAAAFTEDSVFSQWTRLLA